jgi:hypothetical protein
MTSGPKEQDLCSAPSPPTLKVWVETIDDAVIWTIIFTTRHFPGIQTFPSLLTRVDSNLLLSNDFWSGSFISSLIRF